MQKVGKTLLWILAILAWLFILMFAWYIDIPTKNNTHQIILIITGICLAIYIYQKTGSRAKALEKENQQLKAEIQQLRQELQEQAIRHSMDKSEKRKDEAEK